MDCKLLPDDWECPTVRFSCRLAELCAWPTVAGPFEIASKRLAAEMCDLAGDAIQCVPVTVAAIDGTTDDYVVINVLRYHEVWDLSISTWEGASWDESYPFSIRNMMAKTDLDIDDHIFRNAHFHASIIVSTELGGILTRTSGESISLVSVNQWHG